MSARMESRKSKSAVDFLECFRVFDREQNGTINIGELKSFSDSVKKHFLNEQQLSHTSHLSLLSLSILNWNLQYTLAWLLAYPPPSPVLTKISSKEAILFDPVSRR